MGKKLLLYAVMSFVLNCYANDNDKSTNDVFNTITQFDRSGNYEEAIKELEKYVVNKSNISYHQACFMIANYYFESRRGVDKDINKAKKYYNLLLKEIESKAKNIEAQYIIGVCYQNANHKSNMSFEWLEKSAKQGYAPAQAELAFYYMKGIGTNVDFKKAAEWAEKASEQNNMLGKALLGAYYLNVEKDTSKGIGLIKESAEAGNAGGQYMLYRCLYYGKGIKKDRKKAMELLQKAADQGLDDAVTKLSIMGQTK